jgi:ribosome-associated protein
MELIELLNLILKTLEDNKAEAIISLNVQELTTVTDWMVICSATSRRHVHTLGDHIVSKVKALGLQPLGVEGDQLNEWLLVDLGDIVVHIMLPEVRRFYSLEKLWDMETYSENKLD